MTGIALVLILSITVEGIVEYGKTIWDLVTNKNIKTAVFQACALIASVALCELAGADLFAQLGVAFSWTPIGGILTGIFASRGANYVADLIKRLQAAKTIQ